METSSDLWLVPAGKRSAAGEPSLGGGARLLRLTPHRLLHLQAPGELLVHRGRLRVSELRDDGTEIARHVAQAGDCFRCVRRPPAGASAYPLDRTVLMALGESRVVLSPLPEPREDTS